MKKLQISSQSIYLSVIGLLLGFIIGFFYANHYNYSPGATPGAGSGSGASGATSAASDGQLPPDHPPIANEQEISQAIKAADAAPNDYNLQMQTVETLYRASRIEDALRLAERAVKLKPDGYDGIVQMGNLNYDFADRRIQQGDSDGANPYYLEAAKWYERALKQRPADVNVRTDYGLTFYFRKPPDLDKAIAAYRKSLEVNPDHPQTLYNITIALTDKGELTEAEATLAKLSALAPGAPILGRLRKGIEEKRSGAQSSGPAPRPLSVK